MALDIFRADKSANEAAGHIAIALTIFALEGCIRRQEPYTEVLSPFWRDMNFPGACHVNALGPSEKWR